MSPQLRWDLSLYSQRVPHDFISQTLHRSLNKLQRRDFFSRLIQWRCGLTDGFAGLSTRILLLSPILEIPSSGLVRKNIVGEALRCLFAKALILRRNFNRLFRQFPFPARTQKAIRSLDVSLTFPPSGYHTPTSRCFIVSGGTRGSLQTCAPKRPKLRTRWDCNRTSRGTNRGRVWTWCALYCAILVQMYRL